MSGPMIYKKNDSYLVTGDTVKEKEVKWLWRGWLLQNKFQILAADGGIGKSSILYDWGATISVGGIFPDGSRAPKGKVLYITAEDDVSDTIKPRFRAAGGDPKNLLVLDSSKVHLDFSEKESGIDYLISFMQHHPSITLIVIDPIDGYCGNANTHVASVIKKLMGPVNAFAKEYNVCVTGILHFHKGRLDQVSLDNMVSGSKAWISSARLAIVALANPQDFELRYLGVVKSNNSKTVGMITFRLISSDTVPLKVDYIKVDPDVRLQNLINEFYKDAKSKKTSKNNQSVFNISLNEIVKKFKEEGKPLKSTDIKTEMIKRHAFEGSNTTYGKLMKESPYESVKQGRFNILIKRPFKSPQDR